MEKNEHVIYDVIPELGDYPADNTGINQTLGRDNIIWVSFI